jgi:hypothetical protein
MRRDSAEDGCDARDEELRALRAELQDARDLVVQSQREAERARAALGRVLADAALLRAQFATICC